MDYLREIEWKEAHDPRNSGPRSICVPGLVIVGAGPSGLAVAACLKELGVPSVVLERSNCIASLWQLKSYDRLRLHLPKQFCELPLLPFPENFPIYPTKQQFVSYLESYAGIDIRPVFDESVERAENDESIGFWRVKSVGLKGGGDGIRLPVVGGGYGANDSRVGRGDSYDSRRGGGADIGS